MSKPETTERMTPDWTEVPADFLDGLLHAADEDENAGHYLQADYIRKAADEIGRLRIRVARLEGYSDSLAERLRQVRRAAGCDYE